MSCSVLDCERALVAKGYCDTHYRRLKRYGSLSAPERPRRGVCAVFECGEPHAAKGYCPRHWRSWHAHGDPLAAKDGHGRKRRDGQDCDVDGCAQPYRVQGFCDKHYRRWKLHGDPLVVIDPNAGLPWRTKGDYRILRAPGHPIARTNGHILEHRMMLFDAIGPGAHPCRWCGTQVSWDTSWPKAADALVVDHLDRDRSNNQRANLVPSCQSCNAKRANEWRTAVTAPR